MVLGLLSLDFSKANDFRIYSYELNYHHPYAVTHIKSSYFLTKLPSPHLS